MPRRSFPQGSTARFSSSTRCSDLEPRSRRCWSRWWWRSEHGGCCRCSSHASWCFWPCGAAVSVYGIAETLNGNWAVLYLTTERGVSTGGAAFALAAFWAMVTLGRVLIAVISRLVPARWIYAALPVLLLLTFQLASRVQGQTGGIVALGLAGLACSAFLPLSISFGGKEFPRL